MSAADYLRMAKDLEKLRTAMEEALRRIAALEARPREKPVPAILQNLVPPEIAAKVDRRRKEWRERKKQA